MCMCVCVCVCVCGGGGGGGGGGVHRQRFDKTNTDIRGWISNDIHINYGDVITYVLPNFNGGLNKLAAKLR